MCNDELLKIAKRLTNGELASDIAIEMHVSESAIHKMLSRGGYSCDKKLGIWYKKDDKELLELIRNIKCQDYIEEFSDMYMNRYFCAEPYDEIMLDIDLCIRNTLLDDISDKASELKLTLDQFVEFVLLKFLEKNYPQESLKKHERVIEHFDPDTTPFSEIKENLEKYKTDSIYKKKIDKEIADVDEEVRIEIKDSGLDKNADDYEECKLECDCEECEFEHNCDKWEYEEDEIPNYKKKWHERGR